MKPLSLSFNAAVVAMAARVCPTGYDVSEAQTITYEQLVADTKRTGRITVNSEFSDATIFGDPEVNWAFRAWHDWTHYTYKHDFTFAGERATFFQQVKDLKAVFGRTNDTALWNRLLYIEICAQLEFKAQTGEFPADQRAFALNQLALMGYPLTVEA